MTPSRSRLLLLIETPDLGGILQLALRDYEVELHAAEAGARDAFRRRSFALALVDLSVATRQSRLELIWEWKKSGTELPVVILSDLPQPNLSIVAFEAGADDFLRKPFHHVELLIRIRKQLLRPRGWARPAAGPRRADGVFLGREAFTFGEVTVTPDLQARFPDGSAERLRPKQHGILRFFAERAGGLALKADLARAVWGSDTGEGSHTVNEYVSTLRRLFRRHNLDFNELVASEAKVGWRIAAAASPALT
ncbi:MAG TPA: response regulator transcription factor [Opitutaceae bacterium]|nr:response regulator transcription factor [Opitutaceae bacterium]